MDVQRRNGVLLIEGARGSGKTTTLVTLLDVLAQALARPADSLLDGVVPPDPTVSIIPLRIIDVRPLPESTRLLPMILAALEPVVVALPQDDDASSGAAVSPSRAAFDLLMKSATIGWSLELPRGATGETLTADLDMRKAEQLRRSLLPRLGELLTRLADAVKKHWAYGNPLFVISIDDLDMNPGRTAETLDLVRSLSHPRLAFVVTAETELMRTAMTSAFARELAIEGDAAVGTYSVARRLAHMHVEKILPPSNTAHLPALDIVAKVRVFASTCRVTDPTLIPGDGDTTFWAAMADRTRPLSNIAARAAYARPATSLQLRTVVAVAAWRSELESGDYEPSNRIANAVAELASAIVVDTGVLTVSGAAASAYTVSTARATLTAALSMSRRFESTVPLVPVAAVYARTRAASTTALPDSLGRIASLALDLLDDDSDASRTYAAQLSRAPFVAVAFNEPLASDWPAICWPAPTFSSVSQVRLFESALREDLQRALGEQKTQERVCLAFLRAVLVASGDEVPSGADGLLAIVKRIGEGGVPWVATYAESNLCLLAAPESGLDAGIANQIWNALDPGARRHFALRREQWIHETFPTEQQATAVLRTGRERSPGHACFVQARVDDPDRAAQLVLDAIKQIHSEFGSQIPHSRLVLLQGCSVEDAEWLSGVVPRASSGRSGLGGLARFVEELWNRYCDKAKLDRTVRSAIEVVGTGVIQVSSVMELNAADDATAEVKNFQLPSGQQIVLAPVRIRLVRSAPSAQSWPVFEFLQRTAWDIGLLQGSERFLFSSARDEPVYFPGLGDPEGRRWLGPPDQRVAFWEQLADSWNRVVQRLDVGRLSSEHQEWIDTMALRWVHAFPSSPGGLESGFNDLSRDLKITQVFAKARPAGSGERFWTMSMLRLFCSYGPGVSRARQRVLMQTARDNGLSE